MPGVDEYAVAEVEELQGLHGADDASSALNHPAGHADRLLPAPVHPATAWQSVSALDPELTVEEWAGHAVHGSDEPTATLKVPLPQGFTLVPLPVKPAFARHAKSVPKGINPDD